MNGMMPKSVQEIKAGCWELARAMVSEVVRDMRTDHPDYDPVNRRQMVADAAKELIRKRLLVRRKA